MEQIFQILETIGKVFIVSWFITRFKPLTWVLELLPDKLAFNLVKLLLTCLTCVSFWLAIAYTQNVWLSALCAFVGFWYDKIFGFYENKIRLN
jgi:hypothetical protein